MGTGTEERTGVEKTRGKAALLRSLTYGDGAEREGGGEAPVEAVGHAGEPRVEECGVVAVPADE